MAVTINDILPIGLCLATEELFDARRFRGNFGDNIVMRSKDSKLSPKMIKIKRELNSMMTEHKFLEGHKTAILSNMDKILSLVPRYAEMDLRGVEAVISNGKELIDKVIFAESFEDIAKLEPEFKSKIMLPVYSLFIKAMKRDKVSFV
jgi:hypothetical protein